MATLIDIYVISFFVSKCSERSVCVHLVYDAFNIQPNGQSHSTRRYYILLLNIFRSKFDSIFIDLLSKKKMNERAKQENHLANKLP